MFDVNSTVPQHLKATVKHPFFISHLWRSCGDLGVQYKPVVFGLVWLCCLRSVSLPRFIWALFVCFYSLALSLFPIICFLLDSAASRRHRKWFTSERNKTGIGPNTSFHLCKLSSQILKLLCEFCFTLISYYSVNLEDKRVSVENKLRNTLLNNSITICGLYNSSSVWFSELINKSVDMKSKLLKIYLKYEYKYKLSLTRSFRNSSVSVSFVVFSSEFGLTGNVSCGNPASSSPETPGSY